MHFGMAGLASPLETTGIQRGVPNPYPGVICLERQIPIFKGISAPSRSPSTPTELTEIFESGTRQERFHLCFRLICLHGGVGNNQRHVELPSSDVSAGVRDPPLPTYPVALPILACWSRAKVFGSVSREAPLVATYKRGVEKGAGGSATNRFHKDLFNPRLLI
ncbi:hypothetical protein BDK51DRAFT_43330 [Blyttiomyces helicus]|uniref:Uncharacterized protein n=1 Tax=Blyttiomyces helicus TaxID=388810 RepID=A0A4P9VZB6_9FUNG|nr:hypothetical protein BDK51DRAFT_43330 [Blyttiomyces helicus]|eukprot:RKO85151.1 hypothetical protein BDK51DRAFT_43330 [Blyttiomyces helicus]